MGGDLVKPSRERNARRAANTMIQVVGVIIVMATIWVILQPWLIPLPAAAPSGLATRLAWAFWLDSRVHGVDGLKDGMVLQRRAGNPPIDVSGVSGLRAERIDAAVGPAGGEVLPAPAWRPMGRPRWGRFQGRLVLPDGWSLVGLQAVQNDFPVWRRVFRVGVGEVFLVAGQSNALGSAGTLFGAPGDVRSGRLTEVGQMDWFAGDDPQSSQSGGSVWPLVGAKIAVGTGVPVAFINVAIGQTRVAEWLPGTPAYERMKAALRATRPHFVRAVLWHQGEADVGAKTSEQAYYDHLADIIREFRRESPGLPVPWLVSLNGNAGGAASAEIRRAQARIVRDGLALPGPDTDDLGPRFREADLVHFNEAGTRRAAERWHDAIRRAFFRAR